MKILFVTSEVAPFAKAGGLGDVSSALPKALVAMGHDVRVVVPYYRRIWEAGHPVERVLKPMHIDLGQGPIELEIFEGGIDQPDDDDKNGKTANGAGHGLHVPVYFVHCPHFYGRPNIYGGDADEHQRFALLNWAALCLCQQLEFAPDVIHVNDWPTSLIPLMLKTVFAWDRLFENTRTVLTIHNIGHQGTFPASVLGELGLSTAHSAFHQTMLDEGKLSFMLTGLLYANAITTVSPTYAREIQTPEHGVGLDSFLRARSDVVFGLLNGIDPYEWGPSTDPHLPVHFSVDDMAGKDRCKRLLCEEAGLPYREGTPLIGIVSRLVWQKGFDLCFDVIPDVLGRRDAQLVVLGSGEPKYEAFFGGLARIAPEKVALCTGFSERLAHLIEAGSDMFLMPSRYEPCGLNQMYSFAYGTPPIVHKTGGLADTVRQWMPERTEGNGFIFDHFDTQGLRWALERALDCFADRSAWARLVDNCMREDSSWAERVKPYDALYRRLLP